MTIQFLNPRDKKTEFCGKTFEVTKTEVFHAKASGYWFEFKGKEYVATIYSTQNVMVTRANNNTRAVPRYFQTAEIK